MISLPEGSRRKNNDYNQDKEIHISIVSDLLRMSSYFKASDNVLEDEEASNSADTISKPCETPV